MLWKRGSPLSLWISIHREWVSVWGAGKEGLCGVLPSGGIKPPGAGSEVQGAHDPPVVQKGGVDRQYIFRLVRDALGVPYSEMVNT